MKKFYYITILFISFLINFSAIAENFNEKDVEKFIINMGDQSSLILNNKNLTAKQKEIKYRDFTDKIVDSEWVARFILGNYWKQLNSDQRNEFIKLYREYLLENYIPKLKDYNKDLVVTKIDNQRKTVYMVYTKTKDANNREINVNFRVIERNNKLLITDIIPEGISFIGNQRTDIGTAISKDGYDKFVEELKKKINNK